MNLTTSVCVLLYNGAEEFLPIYVENVMQRSSLVIQYAWFMYAGSSYRMQPTAHPSSHTPIRRLHKKPEVPLKSQCLVCPLWATVDKWQCNMAETHKRRLLYMDSNIIINMIVHFSTYIPHTGPLSLVPLVCTLVGSTGRMQPWPRPSPSIHFHILFRLVPAQSKVGRVWLMEGRRGYRSWPHFQTGPRTKGLHHDYKRLIHRPPYPSSDFLHVLGF